MAVAHSTPAPLNIALVGYGAMGHEVERRAADHGAAISTKFDIDHPLQKEELAGIDVAIEFTRPDAALNNMRTLLDAGVPVVVGTTGWLEQIDEVEAMVEASGGHLLYATNFSIGVNILFSAVRTAARLAERHGNFDVGVHEIHHVHKADSPSGTAFSLAAILLEELSSKRGMLTRPSQGPIPADTLHVTSQRLGETVGIHTVSFDGSAETIELTHRAKDRSGFADGALVAARWLVAQKPGLYRFEQIFETR